MASEKRMREEENVDTKVLENFLFGAGAESESDDDLDFGIPQQAEGEQCAWHDSDDEKLTVGLNRLARRKKLKVDDDEDLVDGSEYVARLRKQFVKMQGEQSWAQEQKGAEESDCDSDADLDVLKSSGKLIVGDGGCGELPASELAMRRLKDANRVEYSKCSLEVVDFHPTTEVFMTAGRDKTLRLFHVDGEENPKLASYHFKDFLIQSGCFADHGKQILLTSLHAPLLYSYDVATGQSTKVNSFCGRKGTRAYRDVQSHDNTNLFSLLADDGYVVLCDKRTKHLARSLKMTAEARASCFHPTRATLLTADKEASIYEWDVSTGRCLQRVHDDMAVNITSMACSSKSMLACGTSSGTVDLFDINNGLKKKPVKSLTNLVTDVTGLKFHPDGDVLCMASNWKKTALRMVHMPTMTVFPNWPTQQTPANYVYGVAFSSKGHLAFGNDKGKALLYQMGHYAQ